MGTVADKVKNATGCCAGDRHPEEKNDFKEVNKDVLAAEDEIANGDQFLENREFGNALKSYYDGLELYKNIEGDEDNSLEQAIILCKIASVNLEENKPGDAINMYEEAIDMIRKNPKGKKYLSDVTNSVAVANLMKSDYSSAMDLFNKAYDLEVINGKGKVLAGILNNIGLVYLELNKLKKAKEYFERAIQMLFEKFENENIENNTKRRKSIKKNIEKKKNKKMEESSEKTINLETTTTEDKIKKKKPLKKKKSFGEDVMIPKDESSQKIFMESSSKLENENTLQGDKILGQIRKLSNKEKCVYADVMTNLGIIFEIQNEQEYAIKQYKMALKVYKQIYDKNHSKIALVLNNLGNSYRKAKKYKNAKKFYDMSVEMKLIVFGEDNIQTAEAYSNLGILFEEQGNLEKASEFYSKSFEIKQNLEDELISIESLQNLLRIFNQLEKYEKSIEIIEKIIEIQETIYENDDIEFVKSYINLAWVYKMQKNYKEALKNFEIAELTILKKKEENNEIIGYIWCNLAEISEIEQNLEKAKEYYKKAIDKLNFSREIKGTLLVNFGTILYNEGNVQEAQKYLLEANKIFTDLFEDKKNPMILECQNRLNLL